jgi:microcystin-dependent protein
MDVNERYLIPVGGVIYFADVTPPPGFLVCDGSAVSRSKYAALFRVIGVDFGAGDGSTTFNLPNLGVAGAGRWIIRHGQSGTLRASVGSAAISRRVIR